MLQFVEHRFPVNISPRGDFWGSLQQQTTGTLLLQLLDRPNLKTINTKEKQRNWRSNIGCHSQCWWRFKFLLKILVFNGKRQIMYEMRKCQLNINHPFYSYQILQNSSHFCMTSEYSTCLKISQMIEWYLLQITFRNFCKIWHIFTSLFCHSFYNYHSPSSYYPGILRRYYQKWRLYKKAEQTRYRRLHLNWQGLKTRWIFLDHLSHKSRIYRSCESISPSLWRKMLLSLSFSSISILKLYLSLNLWFKLIIIEWQLKPSQCQAVSISWSHQFFHACYMFRISY